MGKRRVVEPPLVLSELLLPGLWDLPTPTRLLLRGKSAPGFDHVQMASIALIRQHEAPIKRGDGHVLLALEAIIVAIGEGRGQRDVLWGLIKTLVPFPREAVRTMPSILLGLGPQPRIRSTDLSSNITSQLCRESKLSAYVTIDELLQPHGIRDFSPIVGGSTGIVQAITIGQRSASEVLSLLGSGDQLQFGSQRHTHATSIPGERAQQFF